MAGAIGLAVVPVLFMAAASATGRIAGLDDATAWLALAAAAGVSAVVGFAIMKRSAVGTSGFGWRRPAAPRSVLWYVPPLVVVTANLATSGAGVPASQVGPLVVLCLAVGVNEEIWFRGLVAAALAGRGWRWGVVGSSALFAVFHLANAAQGKDAAYLAGQVVFAALFALVAAMLVGLSGSLWPVIAWHAAYDLSSYLGGDSTSGAALVSLVAQCLLLAGYACWLWRRLSGRARTSGQ